MTGYVSTGASVWVFTGEVLMISDAYWFQCAARTAADFSPFSTASQMITAKAPPLPSSAVVHRTKTSVWGLVSAASCYTAEFWSTTPEVLVRLLKFCFLILRWGCRKHSVSGRWHFTWARLQSSPQRVPVAYIGGAASWRPCNVAHPHQGPVPHS